MRELAQRDGLPDEALFAGKRHLELGRLGDDARDVLGEERVHVLEPVHAEVLAVLDDVERDDRSPSHQLLMPGTTDSRTVTLNMLHLHCSG